MTPVPSPRTAPICICPDHGSEVVPVDGGARGVCKRGGETRQIEVPEVTHDRHQVR